MGTKTATSTTSRPTPIADALQAAVDWYTAQTGIPPSRSTKARALEVLLYAERMDLALEELVVYGSIDQFWSGRSNRTDVERLAAPIGSTHRGASPQHLFVLPTAAAHRRLGRAVA